MQNDEPRVSLLNDESETRITSENILKDSVQSIADESINEYLKTLYIGNIPWDVKEPELAEFLKNYTDLLSVRIIRDRFTGRSRGFGYAQIRDLNIGDAIDKLQGVIYKGRSLRINEATSENSRSRSARSSTNYSSLNEGGDKISNKRIERNQTKDMFRIRKHGANMLNELSEEQAHSPGKSFF